MFFFYVENYELEVFGSSGFCVLLCLLLLE